MIMKHKPKYRKKHVKRRKLIEVDYDATLFTDKDLFSKQDMIYNNIEKKDQAIYDYKFINQVFYKLDFTI